MSWLHVYKQWEDKYKERTRREIHGKTESVVCEAFQLNGTCVSEQDAQMEQHDVLPEM